MTRAEKVMSILEYDIDHLTLDEIAELAGLVLTYSSYRLESSRILHFLKTINMNDLMKGFALCQPPTANVNISQSLLFSPLPDAQEDTSIQSVD